MLWVKPFWTLFSISVKYFNNVLNMFLQNVMAKTFLKPFYNVLKRFVLAGILPSVITRHIFWPQILITFWLQILQGILTSDITRYSDLRYYKVFWPQLLASCPQILQGILSSDITRHFDLRYYKAFWPQILQGILTWDITWHSNLRLSQGILTSDITRYSDLRYYKAFWLQILQGIQTSDFTRHSDLRYYKAYDLRY